MCDDIIADLDTPLNIFETSGAGGSESAEEEGHVVRRNFSADMCSGQSYGTAWSSGMGDREGICEV